MFDKRKRDLTRVNATGKQIITNGMDNWIQEIKKEEIKFEINCSLPETFSTNLGIFQILLCQWWVSLIMWQFQQSK